MCVTFATDQISVYLIHVLIHFTCFTMLTICSQSSKDYNLLDSTLYLTFQKWRKSNKISRLSEVKGKPETLKTGDLFFNKIYNTFLYF